MSNGIRPLHTGASNPYLQTRATNGEKRPAAVRPGAETPETVAQRAPAPALEGLSRDERDMILEQFPHRSTPSLRLYGPGGQTQDVAPTAVGSRLDLSA